MSEQQPHDLLTTPAVNEAPQMNTCLRCGAHTEGNWLPELPCSEGDPA